MGTWIGQQGHQLVYGGGNIGLMGILADAALQAGARVIGVIPRALEHAELAHRGIQDLRVVGTMHERKALMADLSDAFIALPGGFGTFDEFCEIITWAQLGIHQKPVGLLNVDGFFDPLLALFDRAVQEGFLKAEQRSMISVADSPNPLWASMQETQPVAVLKWVDRDAR